MRVSSPTYPQLVTGQQDLAPTGPASVLPSLSRTRTARGYLPRFHRRRRPAR